MITQIISGLRMMFTTGRLFSQCWIITSIGLIPSAQKEQALQQRPALFHAVIGGR
jgi:hypothetical protein